LVNLRPMFLFFKLVLTRRFTWLLLSLPLLASCGHTPVTQTLVEAFGKGTSVSQLQLNPKFQYLKVTSGKSEALMVLGYTNDHPQGPIQTWYSKSGEVLQLQNGRIVSTKGLLTDWRAVQYQGLPPWNQLLNAKTAIFTRARDEMPRYRFGVTDTISLQLIKPPTDAHLQGVSPSSLVWFEERVQGQALASARFGLKVDQQRATVVYGEQCLSVTLCIAWQTWPATP
jgi:hypothetical protein